MSQMFSLSPSHPMPLYAQLTRAIQFAIVTGRLQIGEQLPTVRQLAVELRVNANTVAKVYSELERAGVLETRRGVGTFIRGASGRGPAPPDRERSLAELAARFNVVAAILLAACVGTGIAISVWWDKPAGIAVGVVLGVIAMGSPQVAQ